jgi:hypothetical protein
VYIGNFCTKSLAISPGIKRRKGKERKGKEKRGEERKGKDNTV